MAVRLLEYIKKEKWQLNNIENLLLGDILKNMKWNRNKILRGKCI
jgi:hypothetical protein